MVSWEIARVADHLKRQSARLCGGEGPRLPSLFLFTDGARAPDPLRDITRLPQGSGVVYRPYTHQAPQALGERVAAACREAGHVLLVGRDARLALKLRADGLHHPSWDAASRHPIPTMLRHRWLVTAAAHSMREMKAAEALGADAVFLSPVFPSLSHPNAQSLGVIRFSALARQTHLPVLALGGISGAGARRLTASGAAGLAGISFIGG